MLWWIGNILLLVAALAGSTGGYLWLLFVARDSPRVSLLTLLAVFVLATAVTAWHHRERLNRRLLSAHLAIGSIVLVTVGGYLLGAEVLEAVHGAGGDLYQAFVSGSLVHVVFHQGRHDHTH